MRLNLSLPVIWKYKEQWNQPECNVFNGPNCMATMFVPNLKKREMRTNSYIALKFSGEDWEIKNGNKSILDLLFHAHIINMLRIGDAKPSLVYKSKNIFYYGKVILKDNHGQQMFLNPSVTELSDTHGNLVAKFNESKEQGNIEIFKKENDLTIFLLFVIYRKFQEHYQRELGRFG